MFSKYAIAATLAASFGLQTTISRVTADDGPQSKPTSATSEEPTPGTAEYVERALRKNVTLNADDVPLRDVLKDLSKQVDVPILVQTSALDAVGLFADDTKITISLKGLSLRSVLRVVLADLELTYMNYEGVVLVTTPEYAEQNLVTKIHEVVDLISRDEDTPPSDYDYNSLIEVIKITIVPTMWDEVGGPCTVAGYRGTIVVSATTEAAPDSFSILPLLQGRAWATPRAPVIHHSAAGMFAIRDGKWKLVLGNGSGGRQQPRGKPFAKPYKLIDLSGDISETTNVAERFPDVAKRLEQACAQIRESGRSRNLRNDNASRVKNLRGSLSQKRELAQVQIRQLEQAIELFALQIGAYPQRLQELVKGPSDRNLAKNFREGEIWNLPIPLDPWGNKYVYKADKNSFEIFSSGPDGKPGSTDDVTSR